MGDSQVGQKDRNRAAVCFLVSQPSQTDKYTTHTHTHTREPSRRGLCDNSRAACVCVEKDGNLQGRRDYYYYIVDILIIIIIIIIIIYYYIL